MTKKEIAMTTLKKQGWRMYQAGYCQLSEILYSRDPEYYNAGVYGWNCDIYLDRGRNIAITTGYRNTRGPLIPSSLSEKYSSLIQAADYDHDKVDALVDAFFEEVGNL